MINGGSVFDSKMVMLSMSSSAIIIKSETYMAIRNNKPMTRKPTHPGQMLREDFMPDYHLSVANLAEALGVSRQTVNEIVHERRAISTEMALRLSKLFGNSAEFWLNAQRTVDLWNASRLLHAEVERIRTLNAA
jgi:addiction module HigA family antidote